MADAQHRADIGRLLCVASAVAILGTSCGNRPATLPSPRPTSTPTDLPTVTPQAPSPDTTAAAFLAAWEEGDYGLMYALLSPESRASTTFQAFTQRYRSSLTTASVLTVTTHLQSVLHRGGQAAAAFAVTLDTALFGALTADATMPLSLGAGAWGIDWDAGLVWPQLAEGRHLHTTYSIPVRANIYDPDGLGLATQGTIVRLGVIPGQIENEAAVLQALTSITGLSADEIRSRYTSANPQWKIPIADIPAAASVKHNTALTSLSGVYREEKEGRTYPHGEAASHVVGWVAPVPAEELLAYRSRGYRGDEMVGVAGLEAWGEEVLAGQHGGTLTIITPDGDELIELAERPAVPGRAIYATLSRGFNEKIQGILGDRKGAIVVLDVRTGAVRGLVSGPG
ncbi:MAG: NTF2-like N-terminal transpeptidase domain-containing protein, partial [Anaerolineae bacterium]